MINDNLAPGCKSVIGDKGIREVISFSFLLADLKIQSASPTTSDDKKRKTH
jgi:hypothetical protein